MIFLAPLADCQGKWPPAIHEPETIDRCARIYKATTRIDANNDTLTGKKQGHRLRSPGKSRDVATGPKIYYFEIFISMEVRSHAHWFIFIETGSVLRHHNFHTFP